MILSGIYQTLTVGRISDFGLYLTDGEENEVLLPNRYVSLENKVGDQMEVFVYHDSEDRLVATTEQPLITVGQVAPLRVVDKTVHGVFLDWGLTAKDLFMPNRNMVGRVEAGRNYVVYAYRDNITGRVVATMSLKSYISNEDLTLRRGDQVDAIVALETPTGFRAVVNGRHWGMLYRNQLFSPVTIGDRMKAYVRNIAEDGRVDLSLQQEGYDEVKKSVAKLLTLIEGNGGKLGLHDGSAPEEVAQATGMSKKVFKRAVGFMMKRGVIEMDERGIRLTGNEPRLVEEPADGAPRRQLDNGSARGRKPAGNAGEKKPAAVRPKAAPAEGGKAPSEGGKTSARPKPTQKRKPDHPVTRVIRPRRKTANKEEE